MAPDPLPYATPGVTAAPAAFTHEQITAINDAKKRFRPIRREMTSAAFYAWSVAIFAALTLIFSLTSPAGLAVGLGLGVFASVQFWALARLRRLDPAAPRILALNHAGLAALLVLYGLYGLLLAPASSEIKELVQKNPDLANSDILQSADQIVHLITIAIYGGVIIFGLLVEGGWAAYHRGRRTRLRDYLQTTPSWIVQMQTAGILQ